MSKLIKRFTAFLIGIAMLSGLAVNAVAESSGFADEKETAVYARTPYDKSYVSILWNTNEAETVGVPLCYGEYVLLPVLNKVNKLTQENGELDSSVAFDEKVSESCKGTVIGDTLIQPTRTSVYVVNLETMSVKSSKSFGEIVTDIAAIDNLIYFGAKLNEGYGFYCADINNNLETIWEYKTDSEPTPPALLNNTVIFGAGNKLICRNKSDFTENTLPAVITSVFAGNYAAFMAGEDGNIYKVRIDDEGYSEKDSLMSCEVGGELSPPVEYENRLYVSSTEGFFILDALNMEIEKSFSELQNPKSSKKSCPPVISYGTGTRVYTVVPHADNNGDRWYLYSILDSEEEITVSEIVKLIDFENGEISVSSDGKMFFRDNKRQLWALSVTQSSIWVMIIKLVLMAGIIVMLILIIVAWTRKHTAKQPPQY